MFLIIIFLFPVKQDVAEGHLKLGGRQVPDQVHRPQAAGIGFHMHGGDARAAQEVVRADHGPPAGSDRFRKRNSTTYRLSKGKGIE